MKNWKQAALAFELNIPEADLDSLGRALDAIERAFRPLISKIPIETDPAVTFFAAPEDAE